MRVFFDTNIYSILYKSGGAEAVREGLRARGVRVVANDANLLEIYANPDESQRRAELQVLTRLATEYLKYPQSWKQAREVRNEIGRCHPEWVRRFGSTASAKNFLAQHRERWAEARRGEFSTGSRLFTVPSRCPSRYASKSALSARDSASAP